MTELYSLAPDSAAARLIATTADDWHAFTRHDFVAGLQQGSLPEACFRHYLVQDYRFLIHFARAWALAAFKSDDVEEIRAAAALVHTLIDQELQLHVRTCAGWGLSEAALRHTPEHPANAAYTRFVLERGLAGDLADLLVALAPCVVGYAEIGARLDGDPATRRDGNPYAEWIATYAGSDYQGGAAMAVAQLDRVLAARLGPAPWKQPRWPDLVTTFTTAVRLEIGFWEMGLAAR
jgi:thiaminase/transcriptional activator TenA